MASVSPFFVSVLGLASGRTAQKCLVHCSSSRKSTRIHYTRNYEGMHVTRKFKLMGRNVLVASSGSEPSTPGQPDNDNDAEQQIEPVASSSSTTTTDSTLSAEEIQKQMGELRRAKQEQELSKSTQDESLINGVMEEVQLIQWPTFTSALLNTLLVISIVFGTSVVLFGVNTALTELSNVIYSK